MASTRTRVQYILVTKPNLPKSISFSSVHIKANRLRPDIRLDLLFQYPKLVSSKPIYFHRPMQNTELYPKVFSGELLLLPTSSSWAVYGVGFASSCSTSCINPLRLKIARAISSRKAETCSSRCSLPRWVFPKFDYAIASSSSFLFRFAPSPPLRRLRPPATPCAIIRLCTIPVWRSVRGFLCCCSLVSVLQSVVFFGWSLCLLLWCMVSLVNQSKPKHLLCCLSLFCCCPAAMRKNQRQQLLFPVLL